MLTRKTPEEIREIALQLHRGEIFTDWQIRKGDENLLGNIFMPLLFMEEKDMEMLKDVGMIYAKMSDAGPRAINGYPIFMSMALVHKEDAPLIADMVRKFKAAEEAVQG